MATNKSIIVYALIYIHHKQRNDYERPVNGTTEMQNILLLKVASSKATSNIQIAYMSS